MDTAFLIVVAAGLCFLSAMIAARIAAQGAPARRVGLVVAELWLAFALWIAVLRPLCGAAAGAEVSNLAARFAALEGSVRVWTIAGAAASVAILAHLLWSLRRMMSGSIGH